MYIDFNHLSPNLLRNNADNRDEIVALWHNFYHDDGIISDIRFATCHFQQKNWAWLNNWQTLDKTDDKALTDWLIELFNSIYAHSPMPTQLVRGVNEPEYFAPKHGSPARIEFAHGFFQSALHEISHWCIAGAKRRQLDDFGYWYCPDGRDEGSQRLFEQVEIKPQAIECLLSLAINRIFFVSQDNLNADFDTSGSTFAGDVFAQAYQYLQTPNRLPTDARRLIWLFYHFNQPSHGVL